MTLGDRDQALTAADRDASPAVMPRNDVEARLATIWERRLHVAGVGVHDDFFELGGDSILGLQIVADCAQVDLHLTLEQFLRGQTIAVLADQIGRAQSEPSAQYEADPATGPVAATPNMLWYFEKQFIDAHQCNGTLLLELPGDVEPEILRHAVQHIWVSHEALRLRFAHDADAGWQQTVSSAAEDVPFVRYDVIGLTGAEQREIIERRSAELQASLNLTLGPNVRFGHFDLGRDRPGRLLLVLHYLVLDNVSRAMLVESLQRAVRQLQEGERLQPPPPSLSFRRWAQQLSDCARSAAVAGEIDYWLQQSLHRIGELPLDDRDGENSNASNRELTFWLNVDETRALAERVAVTHDARLNEVLLAAVVRTLARWTASPVQEVELVGHGRAGFGDDVDPSRIVGRLAIHYPLVIDLRASATAADALTAVKARLRQVPNGGIGYGLLRYLGGDAELSRRLNGPSDVWFDYGGQILEHFAGSLFKPAQESRGPDRSPHQQRAFLLRVAALIDNGRLRIEWAYSENLHRKSTIESLGAHVLDELRSFL
jgi:non-ribosomal peptide synthase protein (TIGR01720 family)